MNERRASHRFCLTLFTQWPSGWMVAVLVACIAVPGWAQPDVGEINGVRLVDTGLGQDIEISSSLPPSSFRSERVEGCTFALVVPNLLPGPDVAGQFFSSDLVERLTLRAEREPASATRICVKANVPVRSRVALRASGLILRLERTTEQDSLLGAGESFRPVDEESAGASLTPPTGGRSDQVKAAASGSRAQRELQLSAREAQVEVRELKLEIGQLRRQLSEQVSASAAIDQELVRRQGDTDQLTPRIERLLRALEVDGNALEQPVERFDAALAALQRRLVDVSVSSADYGALRSASDELVASLRDYSSGSQSVMTNEDVNVRLGPSTDAIRVAFLPKGVLLLVKERRGAWSLVSAGRFEGWIFDELLSKEPISGSVTGVRTGETDPAYSSAEQLRWAREQVLRLQHKLGLAEVLAEAGAQHQRELEARQGSFQAAETGARESTRLSAALQSEVEELRSLVQNLESEGQGLLARVQDAEAERQSAVSVRDRALVGCDQADAVAARESCEREVLSKLQALASLTDGQRALVVTTDLTNLRAGPGVDQERLALLPRDFELTLLSQENDWYEVLYGSLRGWVSAEFSRVVDQDAVGQDLHGAPIDVLMAIVERSLTGGSIESSNALEYSAGDGDQGLGERPPSVAQGALLQSAADAIYAHSAAARRGDVEAYVSFYSERFVPQEGTREAWEQDLRQQFLAGVYNDVQIQNLALRRISDSMVEARFRSAGGDEPLQRVDLLREEQGWKVLLETVAVGSGEQE